MILIEMKQVTKTYKKIAVIRTLDLAIEKGEIAGIIGPNGVGKSTLLNMMSGLVKPDKGEVIFDGKPVIQYRSSIGFVPQEIALYQDLTVRDNLKFFAGIYGLKKNDYKERTGYIIEKMELQGHEGKKVRELSGGMKRRLNIGVELLKNPKVLIMDEPTVGIDLSARAGIMKLLEKINAEGITIVFTGHYMSELSDFCTKFYFIKNGSIELSGSLEEIFLKHKGSKNLETVYRNVFDE
jgi:ABC-2 type transport system ATP-binding protein